MRSLMEIRKRRRAGRRGMIAVAVLVCLLVATMIGASLIRLAQTQRATIRAEERRLQADWLAESGMERAAGRLAVDPDYRGETWEVAAADLGGGDPGRVTIAVEARPDDPRRRLVAVQADYPTDPDRRARSSKRLVIAAGPGHTGEEP
jgi:Tfp pilus assembly protein PilX